MELSAKCTFRLSSLDYPISLPVGTSKMNSKWIETLISGAGVIDIPSLTISSKSIGELSGMGRLEWKSDEALTLHAGTPVSNDLISQFVTGAFDAVNRVGILLEDDDYVTVTGKTNDQECFSFKCLKQCDKQIFCDSLFITWKPRVSSISFIQNHERSIGNDFVHALYEPELNNWPQRSTHVDDNPEFGRRMLVHDWLQCQTKIGQVSARRVEKGKMQVKVTFSGPVSEAEVKERLWVIEESMGFLLGRDCILRGYEASINNGMSFIRNACCPNRQTTKGSVCSPIGTGYHLGSHIESLLACSVNLFCTRFGQDVAKHLRVYRGCADNSLISRIAITCICLEGLLKTVFKTACLEDSGFTLEDVRNVQELLKGNRAAIVPQLYTRLEGMLNSIFSLSAKSILHYLRDSKTLNVEQADIAAWKELRHSSAHGGLSLSNESEQLQKILDQYYRLQSLIVKVALYAMNYSGHYIDLSKRGSNVQIFPHVPS